MLTKFLGGHPEYPIGLPVAWRLSVAVDARGARVSLAVTCSSPEASPPASMAALAVSVHRSAVSALAAAAAAARRRSSGTPRPSDSPISRSSCVATVGLLLLLDARDDPGSPPWAAGAALGFLAWIKTRGPRPRRAARGACGASPAPCPGKPGDVERPCWRRGSPGARAASVVRHFWLSPGVEFLDRRLGCSRRGIARATPLRSRDLMLENLTGSGVVRAVVPFRRRSRLVRARAPEAPLPLPRRSRPASPSTRLCTSARFFDPADHIQTSFHRLAAASPAPAGSILGVLAGRTGRDHGRRSTASDPS